MSRPVIPLLLVSMLVLTACNEVSRVTVRTDDLVRDQNARLAGSERTAPQLKPDTYAKGNPFPKDTKELEDPATLDPPAEDLPFTPRNVAASEAQAVIDRIRDLAQAPVDAEPFTIDDSIRFAQANATEYSGAEESYLLTALSLIIAEHAFEPRFFNTTSLDAGWRGSDRYETALKVSNDFGVRQKLPYGGEVTARFLANLTQNLDGAASDAGVNDAAFVLEGTLPLLRGAGLSARESLIQARRNLVYAAREFERFRRDFYVAIVSDYLDLVLRLRLIINAERGVELNRQVEARETAMVQAGRQDAFQADQARTRTLFALDDLAQQQEAFRLALDRFKVRIGMDTQRDILIVDTELQLPVPDVSQNQAVLYALDFRLDLQTARDVVEDKRRQIDIAENGLLPDLDLRANVQARGPTENLGTWPTFSKNNSTFTGGLFFSAPLDRVDEAVALRTAQVVLAQGERALMKTLDEAALEVRRAIRDIDRAQFSLLLSARNVEIAENLLEKIDVAPDRASARDRIDGVADLRDAEDSRDDAKRNLQVAILQYLRSAGLLRVTPEGDLQPLPNMPVGEVIGKTMQE